MSAFLICCHANRKLTVCNVIFVGAESACPASGGWRDSRWPNDSVQHHTICRTKTSLRQRENQGENCNNIFITNKMNRQKKPLCPNPTSL